MVVPRNAAAIQGGEPFKLPLTLKQGRVMIQMYAVNTSDKERMRKLLEPTATTDPAAGRSVAERIDRDRPVAAPGGVGAEAGGQTDRSSGNAVDLSQADVTRTKLTVKASTERMLEK